MNVLAIETSTSILSVACRRSDGVSLEMNLEGGLRHSENLVPLIQQVLDGLQLRKKDLNVLACSVGPGSFTGLRIGLATVKGLAIGLQKKIVGVSSLDVIAEGVSLPSGKLAVILDARRHMIYGALYQFKNGNARKILKDSLLSFDQLVKRVDRTTAFVGDALVSYGDKIKQKLGSEIAFLDKRFWNPKASSVLNWFQKQNGKVTWVSLDELKPAYLRLSQAEERRKRK